MAFLSHNLDGRHCEGLVHHPPSRMYHQGITYARLQMYGVPLILFTRRPGRRRSPEMRRIAFGRRRIYILYPPSPRYRQYGDLPYGHHEARTDPGISSGRSLNHLGRQYRMMRFAPLPFGGDSSTLSSLVISPYITSQQTGIR